VLPIQSLLDLATEVAYFSNFIKYNNLHAFTAKKKLYALSQLVDGNFTEMNAEKRHPQSVF